MLRRAGAVLITVIALALPACRRRSDTFPGAPVFVVSIDTLRADHLPAYGYSAVATPALDALARESLVFENALSHVPLTLPSHVSLFTGALPYAHGVRDNTGYRLGEGRPTLAKFLRTRGYATGGAVSAVVLDRGTGVARGFDFWEDGVEAAGTVEALGQVQRSGLATERLLESWIDENGTRRSIFAFLHLYEPHTPYEPPEPFRSRYAGRPYDGEIAAADDVLGRFVAFLKRKNLYDGALLVVLSDHGEGLGDHGEDEHGILLYREALHVPLLVRLPGGRRGGERLRQPAGLIDVFPTVAAVLGEKPPAGAEGIALIERARAGPPRRVYSETLFPRYHFGWSDLASLSDDRYHYIHSPRPELYDFANDPAERTDLASARPPAFRALRAALEGMSRPLQPPGASDPETLRKLASLGYIGVAAPDTTGGPLPDPRERIGSIARIKDATRLLLRGEDDEAIALLRRLVAENPRMLDVWETLARALRRAGRVAEAREALERADRLAPGTAQILLGLADLALEQGDLERARSFARAARETGAAGALEELSSIELAAGNLDAAEKHAREAQAKSGSARAPLVLLARIEMKRGRFERALTILDDARRQEQRTAQPPLRGSQAVRGDALARLGRETEAREALREEVRSFPDNLDAWSRLALIEASAGRASEFRLVLAEQTRAMPTRASFESAAKVAEIVGDHESAARFRSHARQRTGSSR